MFKIHDNKVYFIAETPDINKVIEIFLPKDDRGTIMDSHEIRVDLCRAVIHMEKKGVRVLKVRNIEDTNKASIDVWHMPEYQEAAASPASDVADASPALIPAQPSTCPAKPTAKPMKFLLSNAVHAPMMMTRSTMQMLKLTGSPTRSILSLTSWMKTMSTMHWMSSIESSRPANIGKRTTASRSRTLSMNAAGLS